MNAVMPGVTEGVVVRHTIRRFGPKDAIEIIFRVGDDEVPSIVWLSEKAVGMAKAKLSKCGFDADAQDLWDLKSCPELLAGNKANVDIENDEKYGPRADIVVDETKKRDIDEFTKMMRRTKPVEAEDASGIPPIPDPPHTKNVPF